MELKCRINDKEYDVIQGTTLADEYNETLDSGSIIIANVEKIEDLRPYDDVFVYSGEFDGFANKNDYSLNLFGLNSTFTNVSSSIKQVTLSIENENLCAIFKENRNYTLNTMTFYVSQSENGTDYWDKQFTFDVTYDSDNSRLVLKIQEEKYQPTFDDASYLYFDFDNNTCSGSFNMYTNDKIVGIIYASTFNFGVYSIPETLPTPTFYKHLLVDQFTEEQMVLGQNIYKYKIQLFSETKGPETIQLPNISITQPLNYANKVSVYEYLRRFLEMYSPKYKKVVDATTQEWEYKSKYILDDTGSLEIFKDVYSPDFSLNNPNLRDVLSQLMLTKDRIPVVNDNVIYAMDITKRVAEFDKTKGEINYYIGSRSSDNHCDNLKRTYNNALSQDNTCRYVENLGFRNSDVSLLTLGNMRLETRFPIYKINKIYMCYFKKGKVVSTNNWVSGTSYAVGDKVNYPDASSGEYYECITANSDDTFNADNWQVLNKQKMFLCKQDITPLVKLNSERNLLTKDFDDFERGVAGKPRSIEEMATYRMCTVGYDIGSNKIEGWGEKYTYVVNDLGWWSNTVSYLENMINLVDEYSRYGIYSYGYITRELDENEIFLPANYQDYTFANNLLVPSEIANVENGEVLKYKCLFFQIDYQGFFNGTVIHSKDDARDNVTINDNSSSSLTLLEQDGLFMKEKANRFGNKAIKIQARYTSYDDIQPLGSYLEDDTIIYHREMSIKNNLINVTYYGTKDYVLKNYFTSVYAKHRTYNLMSYAESVRRSENRKQYIMLSKDSCYYEYPYLLPDEINVEDEEQNNTVFPSYTTPVDAFLSAFMENTKQTELGYYPNDKLGINKAYIIVDDNLYASDLNAFVSGYSLCFNLAMYDNVSGGVYIKTLKPDLYSGLTNVDDDYTGSVQDWDIIANSETGAIGRMSFYVGNKDDEFIDAVLDYSQDTIDNYFNDELLLLPQLPSDDTYYNRIGFSNEWLYKDNKELIDMTFQFEPITDDSDVMFNEWFMKLCNLTTVKHKVDEDYVVSSSQYYGDKIQVITTTSVVYYTISLAPQECKFPTMFLRLTDEQLNNIQSGAELNGIYNWGGQRGFDLTRLPATVAIGVTYRFESIESISSDTIVINAQQILRVNWGFNYNEKSYPDKVQLTFTKTTNSLYTEEGYTTFVWGLGLWEDEMQAFNFTAEGRTERIPQIFSYTDNGKNILAGDSLSESNANYDSAYVSFAGDTTHTTITKNMFLDFSTSELNKTIVYDEFNSSNIPNTLSTTAKVTEYFSIRNDNLGRRYVYVDLSNVSTDVKSIRYYFYDDASESYHFVLGVNLTSEDFTNGYVKIYISLLTTRDKRVYDWKHNHIGNVYNYVDGEKNYGNNQFYAIIEESEE